jgi:hypothetical protein
MSTPIGDTLGTLGAEGSGEQETGSEQQGTGSEQQGTGSPGEAGSFDWGGFAKTAGLSHEMDPETIKEALEFHSDSKGKKVYGTDDLEQEFKARQKAWFEDEGNVKKVEDYYRTLFTQMGLMKEADETQQQGGGSGGEEQVPQAYRAYMAQMQTQMRAMAQQLEDLSAHNKSTASRERGQAWLKNFNTTLSDAVERHGNGVLDAADLAHEIRKAYAAREFSDDSPAGIRDAVRKTVGRLQGMRQQWLKGLGVDQMVAARELPFSRDTKLSEVVMDDEKLDAALDYAINRGMPLD